MRFRLLTALCSFARYHLYRDEMKHCLQDPLNRKDTSCLLSAGLLRWLCSYIDGNIWVAGMQKRAAETPKTRNTDPPKQGYRRKIGKQRHQILPQNCQNLGGKKKHPKPATFHFGPARLDGPFALPAPRHECRLCAFFSLWNKLWPSSSIPFFFPKDIFLVNHFFSSLSTITI